MNPIVLDGAMGTVLASRGVPMQAPLFSVGALLTHPQVVEALHLDYLRAGADVISANSFYAHGPNLARAGLQAQAPLLAAQAIALAQSARTRFLATPPAEGQTSPPKTPRPRIAGTVSPLRPSPARAQALRTTIEAVVEAGCDLLLLETMTDLDTLDAALLACRGVDCALWVSVVPSAADGQAFMAAAAGRIEEAGAQAMLINCCDLRHVPAALCDLDTVTRESSLKLGLYPHVSQTHENTGAWIQQAVSATAFANAMAGWQHEFPRLEIFGSCCGSTPEWTHSLREALARPA